jgi:hypothetical protein
MKHHQGQQQKAKQSLRRDENTVGETEHPQGAEEVSREKDQNQQAQAEDEQIGEANGEAIPRSDQECGDPHKRKPAGSLRSHSSRQQQSGSAIEGKQRIDAEGDVKPVFDERESGSENSRLIALSSAASAVLPFMSCQPPGRMRPSAGMSHIVRMATEINATADSRTRFTQTSFFSRYGSGSLGDKAGVSLCMIEGWELEI